MDGTSQTNDVTVCITGDIDSFKTETIEECLEPLLGILEKYEVKITVPITAKALQDYPKRAEIFLKYGHELAVHGEVHQPFYGSVKEQVNRLRKARKVFNDVLGYIPTGFRAPWLAHDTNTYLALIETGFLYDSSRSRSEILTRLPFINTFSYDWRVFSSIKPLLRWSINLRQFVNPIRQGVAKPVCLHNRLIELPITGPNDFDFISSEKGPKYSPTQAHRIAEIWLDIVKDMKSRENQLLVVLAHPGRVSPSYLAAIDLFLNALRNDDKVDIRLLEEVAKSYIARCRM